MTRSSLALESPLRLFNSLTRTIEEFSPIHTGEARVYSCGPTVYNYPHIGNMRAYVFADLLGRVLTYKGYKLTHVINITDVGHLTDDADSGEDKLEKAAAAKAQSIHDIARYYTEAYWDDIRALNIREPAHWPAASDYVAEMIDFAKRIADKHCYVLPSGLYFDISTIADYGRLARQSPIDAVEGADTEDTAQVGRIDAVEGKRHSADFAIWRRTPEGEVRQMEWDSPWGRGAPGWHLECSVMSEKLLGFPFDIHTGGIDHREIHHPNEIAQNQAACSHCGARLWMHNNFLLDRRTSANVSGDVSEGDAEGGEGDAATKMSKSSGEFLRLPLLTERGFSPLAYRLLCLQAHYRSELEFSWNSLQAALTRLKRLVGAVEKIATQRAAQATDDSDSLAPPSVEVRHPKLCTILQDFDKAISEDLNSPLALACLEQLVTLKKVPIAEKWEAILIIDAVLGLDLLTLRREHLRLRPKHATISEDEIAAQIASRQAARERGDYAAADTIRKHLAQKGVALMDGDPLGWDWQAELAAGIGDGGATSKP